MNNIAYCVETFVFFMIAYRGGLGMTGWSHNAGKKRCDCVYGPPKKIDPAANPGKRISVVRFMPIHSQINIQLIATSSKIQCKTIIL